MIVSCHVFPETRWDQSPECCQHTHSRHSEVADRHRSWFNFSRLPNATADKHPKCFPFQFPPSDPLVPDTWRRHRHSQAVESNLPELPLLSGQSRLQASRCSNVGQDWPEFRTGGGHTEENRQHQWRKTQHRRGASSQEEKVLKVSFWGAHSSYFLLQ